VEVDVPSDQLMRIDHAGHRFEIVKRRK